MFSPFVVLLAAIGIEVGATTILPQDAGIPRPPVVAGGARRLRALDLAARRRGPADVGLRGVRRVVGPGHGRDRRSSARSCSANASTR